MSRRIRLGLDYFPIDTSWDLPMRLLKLHHGLEGLGLVIQLQQMIYHEGYALVWNEEIKNLFCSENGIDPPKLDSILEFCLEHAIFDRRLLEQRSVLSSLEIQQQWMRICIAAKRTCSTIEPALNLCPEDEAFLTKTRENSGNIREMFRKFPVISGNFPEKPENLPSKVK